MNVIVHYPADNKSKAELSKRIAAIHSESVATFVKKQRWTKEQKLKILNAVTEKDS